MSETTLNGIDREALLDTLRALKADPSIAAFRFRACNRWIAGGVNRTVIDGYFGACEEHRREDPFVLVNDEPQVLLGTDTSANPLEHLLHALAGCLTTGLVLQATAQGIGIDEIETRFYGDIDLRGFMGLERDIRSGFERITIEMRVKGASDPVTLEQLCLVAQQRSPVFDIISNGVPISIEASVSVPAEQAGQVAEKRNDHDCST